MDPLYDWKWMWWVIADHQGRHLYHAWIEWHRVSHPEGWFYYGDTHQHACAEYGEDARVVREFPGGEQGRKAAVTFMMA